MMDMWNEKVLPKWWKMHGLKHYMLKKPTDNPDYNPDNLGYTDHTRAFLDLLEEYKKYNKVNIGGNNHAKRLIARCNAANVGFSKLGANISPFFEEDIAYDRAHSRELRRLYISRLGNGITIAGIILLMYWIGDLLCISLPARFLG